MGTETLLPSKVLNPIGLILVKLNNPLMGTETFFLIINYPFIHHKRVKLNNPLMGTETYLLRLHQ